MTRARRHPASKPACRSRRPRHLAERVTGTVLKNPNQTNRGTPPYVDLAATTSKTPFTTAPEAKAVVIRGEMDRARWNVRKNFGRSRKIAVERPPSSRRPPPGRHRGPKGDPPRPRIFRGTNATPVTAT